MRFIKKIPRLLMGTIILTAALLIASNASALNTGETYTISIEKVNSDGTVTSGGTSLGLSTTSIADSNGKISFSLSGIPTNDTANFLVITVKDSSGATQRKSIVPAPDPGGSLPAGVSSLTGKQTDALLEALSNAGTDDPILAVFGLAIVRSTSVSPTEVSLMANFAQQGINGTGGYVSYLTSNGVTSTQLTAYRNSIISRLADPTGGYSKLIKDSVDAGTDMDKLNARGEAASVLLKILVQAATTAGFPQDRVLEAFNAMGSVVVPLMETAKTAGDMSLATYQSINSSIGGGIQKLKAEKDLEKYINALQTLGASGGDLDTYQNAASTLATAMINAFKVFEQVFTGSETETEVQAAQNVFDSAMQSAFNQFLTDTAASDTRINTMISNIDTALGMSTGLTVDEFKFYKSDGSSVNWPITMVILVDWVSEIRDPARGSGQGELTYTRDTRNVPGSMNWIGSCSNGQSGDQTNQSGCQMGGDTWSARTQFNSDMDIPVSYASIFGIQEDIMILEFTRWGDESSAGDDMAQHQALERDFANGMLGLSSNIGGTTDGSTSISTTQKEAIVTLLKSPQF